ncbi:hypothetical protein VIGAN_09072500 [Vigna angularis var. angularis]|nr:hypothetical protein VIGAN_09072500 [Vigna angularis var. angularis]
MKRHTRLVQQQQTFTLQLTVCKHRSPRSNSCSMLRPPTSSSSHHLHDLYVHQPHAKKQCSDSKGRSREGLEQSRKWLQASKTATRPIEEFTWAASRSADWNGEGTSTREQ